MSEQSPDAEPTGGRRAERGTAPQWPRPEELPGRAGGARRGRGRVLLRGHQGRRAHLGPVLLQCRGLRRPGHGQGDLPGPGGRHPRRHGPWAEEEGRRRVRRRLHRGRRRQPGLDGHPGGLLPAEEEDAGRRRPLGARRPGQHPAQHGHGPGGAAAHRDPRPARRQDRLPPGGLREGAQAARLDRAAGYADGNAEGYLFPSTYDFGPRETPTSILSTMVARWRQAADEAGLEDAAGARLRAGRGDDRGQPGGGRGAATRTAARWRG